MPFDVCRLPLMRVRWWAAALWLGALIMLLPVHAAPAAEFTPEQKKAIEALIGQDKQLRFVYKEFPVLGTDSITASRAALAARKQGKYDALHRALMGTKGQLDEATVLKVAQSVGLDAERLKRDMAAPEIDRALKANLQLAEALDIRGTPGFVIGDQIVPGAIDLETLKGLIAAARRK